MYTYTVIHYITIYQTIINVYIYIWFNLNVTVVLIYIHKLPLNFSSFYKLENCSKEDFERCNYFNHSKNSKHSSTSKEDYHRIIQLS